MMLLQSNVSTITYQHDFLTSSDSTTLFQQLLQAIYPLFKDILCKQNTLFCCSSYAQTQSPTMELASEFENGYGLKTEFTNSISTSIKIHEDHILGIPRPLDSAYKTDTHESEDMY